MTIKLDKEGMTGHIDGRSARFVELQFKENFIRLWFDEDNGDFISIQTKNTYEKKAKLSEKSVKRLENELDNLIKRLRGELYQ